MLLLIVIFVDKILLQSCRFVLYYLLLLICLSNLPRLSNVRQQKLLMFNIVRYFSQRPLQTYTESQLVTSCHAFRHKAQEFYVSVDRASRYIRVMKIQLVALFILCLFHQSTSTCFGHICSPSSGCILYIYNNLYVLCFLVDCLLAGWPADN